MASRDDSLPVKIGEKILVFVDLETTGLDANCGILQIAALYGKTLFSRYIWPSKPIHPGAAAVNKITVDGDHMYVYGKRVEHVSERNAMTDFAQFIEQVPADVILVAHNGRRFDFPRLMAAMDRHEVRMPSNVVSCLDTLRAFKSLWPCQQSYKLQELVTSKLDMQPAVDAHNAVSDVNTLQQLVAFVPQARHIILEKHLDDVQLVSIEDNCRNLRITEHRK